MIWQPKPVERKQPVEVAFHVSADLFFYLKRVALNQPLLNDFPWPSDLGLKPTFEANPDKVFIGYQSVEMGDWLIGSIGADCLKVVSSTVFNRTYREVTE